MRSQKEILEQIDHLQRTGADPMKVQRKHLIRKLEWKNARPYLKPAFRDDTLTRQKWNNASRLDEEFLKKEMFDFMFGAYDFYIEKDPIGCLVSAQYLIVWLWLLGPREEPFLGHILNRFMGHNSNFCKPIFDDICNHFAWKIKTFFQAWEDRPPRLILPANIKEKHEMDGMISSDIDNIKRLIEEA